MKEQQPYERRLADKLDHMRPPGTADEHWPQMKELLDRQAPKGGGRWWVYGIIAGLLIISGWIGSNYIDRSDPQVAGNTDTQQVDDRPPQNNAALQKAAEARSDPDERPTSNQKITTTSDKTSTQLPPSSEPGETTSAVSSPTGTDKLGEEKIVANDVAVSKKGDLKSIPKNTPLIKNKSARSSEEYRNDEVEGLAAAKPSRSKNQYNVNARPDLKSGVKSENSKKSPTEIISTVKDEELLARAAITNASLVDLTEGGEPGGSIDTMSLGYAILPAGPERINPRFRSNSDRVKALKNRAVGTGTNKNFAIGLSLPLSFPMSDQRAISYNFNAGPNTVSDYLPSPHAQYHFNKFSYIQAEIQ
ncbi:MAG: hypothetical protein H7Y31_15625, partial [Chitinophagaceae bacterium]|nr:hypothetical protein [Chitinophagaceae bacterium]